MRVPTHQELVALTTADVSNSAHTVLGSWKGVTTMGPEQALSTHLSLEERVYYLHSNALGDGLGLGPRGNRNIIACIPVDDPAQIIYKNTDWDHNSMDIGDRSLSTVDIALRDATGHSVHIGNKPMRVELLFAAST